MARHPGEQAGQGHDAPDRQHHDPIDHAAEAEALAFGSTAGFRPGAVAPIIGRAGLCGPAPPPVHGPANAIVRHEAHVERTLGGCVAALTHTCSRHNPGGDPLDPAPHGRLAEQNSCGWLKAGLSDGLAALGRLALRAADLGVLRVGWTIAQHRTCHTLFGPVPTETAGHSLPFADGWLFVQKAPFVSGAAYTLRPPT